MMKVLIMFHGVTVKLHAKQCKCRPTTLKAVPHIKFVGAAKNRSILSQHREGITPVKYNGKPKGVLFLLTEGASFYWQHCTCTFLLNVPSSSSNQCRCSPQCEPLTLSPSAASLLLSFFLSFLLLPLLLLLLLLVVLQTPSLHITQLAATSIRITVFRKLSNFSTTKFPSCSHNGWTDTSNYW